MGNVNELKSFTRGQIDAALMKIGHDVSMGTKEAIEAFLAGELLVSRAVRIWKIFLTIKVGTGYNAVFLEKILDRLGCKINSCALDDMGTKEFADSISATEMSVDLVVASVAELGFKRPATNREIYKRAIELGLDLCQAEDGPQLRRQYLDQPNGERLHIAMKPINNSVGYSNIFVVENCNGKLVLDNYGGNPDFSCPLGFRFVFRRRNVTLQ